MAECRPKKPGKGRWQSHEDELLHIMGERGGSAERGGQQCRDYGEPLLHGAEPEHQQRVKGAVLLQQDSDPYVLDR